MADLSQEQLHNFLYMNIISQVIYSAPVTNIRTSVQYKCQNT